MCCLQAYALWQAHLKRRAPNTQRRQRPGVAAAAIANELDTDSKENEGALARYWVHQVCDLQEH